jgi:hypothetical protein
MKVLWKSFSFLFSLLCHSAICPKSIFSFSPFLIFFRAVYQHRENETFTSKFKNVEIQECRISRTFRKITKIYLLFWVDCLGLYVVWGLKWISRFRLRFSCKIKTAGVKHCLHLKLKLGVLRSTKFQHSLYFFVFFLLLND